MNPYAYKPTPESRPLRQSFLLGKRWHYFVTSVCLLGCIALSTIGLLQFRNIGDETHPAEPVQYAIGTVLLLVGLAGSIYLVRQFRSRTPPMKKW